MKFIKTRLLTPGPTQLPERVRLAMATDMLHHRKPEFGAIFHECAQKLKTVFGTSQEVLMLASSGTGAMCAAVGNLFSPGEEVVVLEGGKFAERWSEIAGGRGLVVHRVPIPWGEAADPHALDAALAAHPHVRGVLAQQSETSTGVLHPIRELGEVARARGVLFVVDGISGVMISPCPMDAWHIDCLVAGSQKGILLPPGLSFIALSEKAWEKARGVTPATYYFDLENERKAQKRDQTAFTPAVSLIVGLRESLRMLDEFGLENCYRRQWALTAMTRAGVGAMGLKLFAKTSFAWGLTSFLVPEGMSAPEIISHAAREYGVILAGGQDRMKGSMIRLAHMGHVDWGDVACALAAVAGSLEAFGGAPVESDFLRIALAAWHEALKNPLPRL